MCCLIFSDSVGIRIRHHCIESQPTCSRAGSWHATFRSNHGSGVTANKYYFWCQSYSSLRCIAFAQAAQNFVVHQIRERHAINKLLTIPAHIIAGVCVSIGLLIIHLPSTTGVGSHLYKEARQSGVRYLRGDDEISDGGDCESRRSNDSDSKDIGRAGSVSPRSLTSVERPHLVPVRH